MWNAHAWFLRIGLISMNSVKFKERVVNHGGALDRMVEAMLDFIPEAGNTGDVVPDHFSLQIPAPKS